MRPSVRQLEYLVAAARTLNFRAAARHCHISQPALSGQIARLEESLSDACATSLDTLAQMVSAGAGVTLLPALSLSSLGALPGLVVRRFEDPVPFRTIGLAWRRTSPRRELFQVLADALRQLEPTCEGELAY